jgi:hypothetical protein
LHPAARISLALAATAAFVCSVTLACADWLASTRTGNARFWEERAAALQVEGRYTESRAALEAAVRSSPRRSSTWIALGLEREAAFDFAAAERCLLEAARIDRTYAPRWTLANFYFRRNDARFWLWARHAADMASRDLTPLLALCSRTTAAPEEIARRIMPGNAPARRAYMTFLLRAGRVAPAGALAAELAPHARAEDRPALLDACNALLAAGDIGHARTVCRAPVESFAAAPTSQGLDWRLPAVEGVWVAHDPEWLALRFSLSGAQPEQCELLWRYLAGPCRFEYETAAPGPGFAWIVLSRAGKALAESADLAGRPSGALLIESGARLALVYRRTPGNVRAIGELWVRNAELHPIP